MQFTGLELTRSRSIYAQNLNFGWALDCYVDNTTGRYEFGVTGTAGSLAFTLQSGRILAGNTFLHNYTANERFYLECQITPTAYNLIKDGDPLVMGAGKTSGDFTSLYFSRNQPTLFADFNFYASGQNVPNVAIDTVGYLLTTGQQSVSGQFNNNGSYPVRVFGSDALYTQGLDFGELAGTVAKQSSGQFAFSGDFSSFNFANPIVVAFATNYRDAQISFTIIDARTQTSYVYFQPGTSFNFNNSGVLNQNLLYNNYSGGLQTDAFPAQITFRLSNVSGTGIVVGGDSYTTTGYGSFAQSGLVTGVAATITGDINVSAFAWATGVATGTFSGVGSGYATGSGYSGIVTGYVTGTSTGRIFDGSGTLNIGRATGIAIGNLLSIAMGTYATGLLSTSGLSSVTMSWNVADSSLVYAYGQFGSGSPTFTRAGPNGTIYWESGEDILYAMSGMQVSFGLTGYVTGQKLFILGTGENLDGDGFSYLSLRANGFGSIYPGAENTPLIGSDATHIPTGYIDLSLPFYEDDNAFRILGYPSQGVLSCVYRPKKQTWQQNTFGDFGNNTFYGSYSDAIILASGFNRFPGTELTGVAVGNRVNLTVRYVGVNGNGVALSYSNYGITGSLSMVGGTVSTAATGYIQLLPMPAFGQLSQLGIVYVNNATGSLSVQFQRYAAAYGSNYLQQFYYQNATDIAHALSGSAVGDLQYNGVASGSGSLYLTSNSAGTGGNLGYYQNQSFTTFTLTGGAAGGAGVPVVAVGTFTGDFPQYLITGSGNYSAVISHSGVFYYKTFTGTWNLFTGLSTATLTATRRAGTFTDSEIQVTGIFPPNSQIAFQITHTSADQLADGARIQISGARVINGIDQTLSQP